MRVDFLFFLFISFISSTHPAVAQKSSKDSIIGCWKLEKIDIIDSTEDDGLATPIQSGDTKVCFKSNGQFSTMLLQKGQSILVGTGKYRVSPDGGTIFQDDQAGQSFKLSSNVLRMETPDNRIITFKRIN